MSRVSHNRGKTIRRAVLSGLLLFLGGYFSLQPASAAINKQLNFQGRLTDAIGNVVADGTYNLDLKLHDHATNTGGGQGACSGSCLWREERTGASKVAVSRGLFSIQLGEVDSLASFNFNQDLYLSIRVGGNGSPSWDSEMTPRHRLGAAPTAIHADHASTADSATTATTATTATNATQLGGVGASTYARKDQSNDFTQSQTISAAGGKTTLSLSSTGTDTGLTLGGDTNLYRSAANTLKTDDSFFVTGSLGVGVSPSADFHISGADSRARIQSTSSAGYTATEYVGDGRTFHTGVGGSAVGVGANSYYVFDSNASSFRTVIDSNGDFGIGDVDPTTRLSLGGTGSANGITFGDDAANSANLYRTSANYLKTDDSFVAASYVGAQHGTANQVFLGTDGIGDAPGISFGSAQDTNLYRSAANILKTDDALIVGTLGSGGTIALCSNAGQIATCSGAGANTLQGAYDGGNILTTGDARDIDITLANTTTDSNFTIDIATSSTSEFQVEANGTDVLQIGSAGQLQLDVQGSAGGLLIGGDTNLYRSAADTLKTDDSFVVGGASFTHTGGFASNAGSLLLSSASGFFGQRGATSANTTVFVSRASADTVDRFTLSAGGTHSWGDGTNAADTNLYRHSADTLYTDDRFVSNRANATDIAFNTWQGSQHALQILAGGKLQWADGTGGSIDTNLYRSAADTLKTDDSLHVATTVGIGTAPSANNGLSVTMATGKAPFMSLAGSAGSWQFGQNSGTGGADDTFGFYSATYGAGNGSNPILQLDSATGDVKIARNGTGKLVIGQDTNLYRSAADTLKTDDALTVAGNLRVAPLDNTKFISFYNDNYKIQATSGLEFHTADMFRFVHSGSERIRIGSGGADKIEFGTAQDTNLYRSNANELKTDDSLIVDAGLTVNGNTTLGNAAGDLVTMNGQVVGAGAATGTTGTTEATARTNVTTVTLTAAGSFANNDVIRLNNAGQDYYTRIVSGGGTTTLTVSPAVSYDVSTAVTKYTIQNIGATSTDYATEANRFFQGYFLGGVVTGAGSTTLSDGNLSSTNRLNFTATDYLFKNSANSTAAFQIQNAAGTSNLFVADTTNSRIGIGTNAPNAQLQVTSGSSHVQIDAGKITGGVGAGAFELKAGSWSNGNIILTPYGASGGVYLNYGGTANNGGLKIYDGGTSNLVASVSGTGATLFQNSANSTAAFQVQNAAGTSNLFVADTTNTRIAIGSTPATSLLTLGTNTTTAAGGLTFGTDTNLYRSAANTLKTDDNFDVAGTAQFGRSGQTFPADSYLRLAVGDGAGPSLRVYADSTATNAASSGTSLQTYGSGKYTGYFLGSNNGVATNSSNSSLLRVGSGGGGIVFGQWDNNPLANVTTAFTTQMTLDAAGQLQLATQGSTGGLLIGGDTNLYRSAADTLATDDQFNVMIPTGSTLGRGLKVSGQAAGFVELANGTSTSNEFVPILRGVSSSSSATAAGLAIEGTPQSDDAAKAAVLIRAKDPSDNSATDASPVLDIRNYTTQLLQIDKDGVIKLGSTGDTNLYRSAADTLKTDDTFDAAAYKVAGTAGSSVTCSGGQFLQNQVVAGGIVTGGSCAAAGGSGTLQGAYDGGNTIATPSSGSARDFAVTLTNSSGTDSNATFNIATGSASKFAVQSNGTDIAAITSAGQLALSTQGSGGGLLLGGDTNLYRSAANTLQSDGRILATGKVFGGLATAAETGIGDLGPSGQAGVLFGNAGDTNLYRSAANVLKTDDDLQSALDVSARSGGAGQVISGARGPSSEAGIQFGSATDTNLYRSAANTLKTDDSLIVAGRLEVLTNSQANPTNGQGLTAQWNYTGGGGEVDFFVNKQGGGNGGFHFYDWNGTAATGLAYLRGSSTNQGRLELPVQGANAGLLLGGDANLYRSAADTLKTDDNFLIQTATNSANALEVKNSTGTSMLKVNTGTGATTQTAKPLESQNLLTSSSNSSDYNMGYKFTPSVNGNVTALGARCTTGTYTVKLYNMAGTQLASASVTTTGTSGNFSYTAITPVALTAGTAYVVAARNGSTYCSNSGFAVPRTVENITINDNRYSSGDNFPTTTDSNTAYGLADIAFETSAITPTLQVTGADAAPAQLNRTTSDGRLIDFHRDGASVGSVSVSSGAVSYNAFTGSHYAQTDESIERGMLVSQTGNNGHLGDRPEAELLYGVKKTTAANDPAVMGSYLSLLEPGKATDSNNPHLINAVGNGEVWVVDTGRNLATGEYLVSSDTAGHAMVDPASDAVSHVVAKAAEPIDWNAVTDTVDGKKRAKVSVFYAPFAKQNAFGLAGINPAGYSHIGKLEVTDDLIARKLTVKDGLFVEKDLEVAGNAQIKGNLKVDGSIEVGTNDRGNNLEVSEGATYLRVNFRDRRADTDYGVQVESSWLTADAVTNKSAEGFTIRFDKAAPPSATFDWFVVE